MIGATQVATSALKAGAFTVEASASNLANMRTTSTPKDVQAAASEAGKKSGGQQEAPQSDVYTPVRVTQETVAGGGVRARYGAVEPSHVLHYDPSDPVADEEGLVARPNVDPASELVTMRQAQRAYEASLSVIETEDRMTRVLLDTPA